MSPTPTLVDRPVLHRPQRRHRSADARWLITFADLAAVMVAFFVLLFAMAEVDSDKWQGATTAFDRQFRISDTFVTPRPVESANITQRLEDPALDLRYLEQLIDEQLRGHEALADVRMAVTSERIALDFPGALIFRDGRAGVSAEGREALFVLAALFASVDNRIAVVGHAAPAGDADARADGAPADTDWEMSLVRAARIGRSLRRAGYDRPIELQGRSSSQFGGAAVVDTTGAPRSVARRRIEIIVQRETGDGR